MARRRLSDTSHSDTSLDDAYWQRFGDLPQPPMRDKIIFLTFEEVARVGPAVFNVSSVCDRLGITHPMVNHYFGGRDALLAETAYVVYQRYINSLWAAVAAAPSEPRARLRAWMTQQIQGTSEIGGWGGILNYPSSSLHISGLLEEGFGAEVQRLFTLNILRLGILVRDLRQGVVSPIDHVDLDAVTQEMLDDPETMAVGASIAWSTLGVAVWNAGQHLPSARLDVLQAHKEALIDAHIDRMINSI